MDNRPSVSQANVDLVRAGWDHFFATGEFPWHTWTSDAVWDMSAYPGWPDAGKYRGRDEIDGFLQTWTAAFDDWSIEVEEYVEAGENVVCLTRQRGRPKGTDAYVEMVFAQVMHVRGGKIAEIRVFGDREEALAATGAR